MPFQEVMHTVGKGIKFLCRSSWLGTSSNNHDEGFSALAELGILSNSVNYGPSIWLSGEFLQLFQISSFHNLGEIPVHRHSKALSQLQNWAGLSGSHALLIFHSPTGFRCTGVLEK